MDYLKPEFHEYLKEEDSCSVKDGRIFIGSKYWTPEDILTQISEGTYKEVFEEWIDFRKENIIQLADDYLNEFDQKERFKKLKQSFENKSVIPFIGAGLSSSSGYPMWTEFLRKLVLHSDITSEQLEVRLQKGEYEEAAQELADDLGPGFSEKIESVFGDKKEIKGVVQLLPSLFDGPVITTNYDSLLKRCYEVEQRNFDEIISGHQAQEISRFLSSGDHVLVKLHGTAMSGLGRILTTNEYQNHYEKNNVLKTVITAFCSKTLLFIGCSLSSDRTIRAIEAFVREKGHDNVSRHYALLKAPDSQLKINEKSKLLADANIYPIWYQGDHEQAVEALLYKLGEE